MQLKQLEIKGFKSFADKTSIRFNQDVTGIVGPNGCGKSNIVDAIRWVLGEQSSKELRSDRMSSLLFNGNNNRRASSMAEVTITFENDRGILRSEYQTVSVSRVLFHTGESEYRINQTPCRLRDIHHLFMDSGITSNSYAIIALSMVDDLLQDRDSSRRRLFEQAAGISGYKLRKKETLQKLDQATTDLNRVNDLMMSMEEDLNNLRKQARRVESYRKLKDRYNDLTRMRLLARINELKALLDEIDGQFADLERATGETEAAIHLGESGLAQLKLLHHDRELQLKKTEKELSEIRNTTLSLEHKLQTTRQQQAFNSLRSKTLKDQLTAGTTKLNSLKEHSDRIQIELKNSLNKLDTAEKAWKIARTNREKATDLLLKLKQETELAAAELLKAGKRYNELLQKQLRDKALAEERQRQLVQWDNDRNAATERLSSWEQEISGLELQISEQQTALNALEQKQSGMEQQLELFSTERDAIRDKLQQIQAQISETGHEKKLTLQYMDSLDGFTDATRQIRKHFSFKLPAPFLSDILDCMPAYKSAVENFLRPWMEHFIVETREEALNLFRWLNDSGKGKASVFVLERIKSKAILPLQPGIPDAVNALDVISCEPKYHPLIQHLLGHVWISPAIEETALPLTLIQSDGSLIQNPLDISGGAVGLFEGRRMGGRKNIELFEQQLTSLEEQYKNLEEKLFRLDEQSRVTRAGFLKREIDTGKQKLEELHKSVIRLQSYMQEHFHSEQVWSQKTGEIYRQLTEWEEQNVILQKEINHLKKEEELARSAFNSLTQQLQEAETQAEPLNKQYNESQVTWVRLQNDYKNLERDHAANLHEQQLLEQSMQQAGDEVAQLADENAGFEHQYAEWMTDHLEQCRLRDHLAEQLKQAEKEFLDIRLELEKADEALKLLQRELRQKSDLKAEVKSRREILLHDLRSVMAQMPNTGADAVELSSTEEPETYDPETVEAEWNKAREKLERFGEVNMLAVEAFEQLSEKYTGMMEQKTDIDEAIEMLRKTISEIEQTATKRFMDAFTQVREHFREVFGTLFDEGDTCDLILEDPSRPLESAILIIARPKGKRPLHINQLSGGEKTLTAISLLFSLYLLKPAPFCIFDEVDAPLDDANVLKFNKIIRKFSSSSQFIIVTHNKLTMAEVDIIYGVTMAEQGISTIVPVSFTQLRQAVLV